ncbi:MAG: hypothetical protein KGN79_09755 [Acidobacteriota bacterium]|nr:hypothetical protein [Acidobacteriota bacterium]
MNSKPLVQSRDPDLRASHAALLRAAERARALARQTGTRLIISYGGSLRRVAPEKLGVADGSADGGKAP